MEIGVDITSIKRFEHAKQNLINKILTEKEIEIFNSISIEKQSVFLATHWAAKEAIFKATQDYKYLKYSILNDSDGKPFVLNHPNIKISISHENDIVIAFVIVLDNCCNSI